MAAACVLRRLGGFILRAVRRAEGLITRLVRTRRALSALARLAGFIPRRLVVVVLTRLCINLLHLFQTSASCLIFIVGCNPTGFVYPQIRSWLHSN
jgi:hypothetical protein